jgi:hypothetical protein
VQSALPARLVIRAFLIVAVVFPAAAYLCDSLWVQYRVRNPNAGDAFGAVTFYYATPLKSGRVEIFFDQPQTEVCVHSLFPHAGHRPCWLVAPNHVKTVS